MLLHWSEMHPAVPGMSATVLFSMGMGPPSRWRIVLTFNCKPSPLTCGSNARVRRSVRTAAIRASCSPWGGVDWEYSMEATCFGDSVDLPMVLQGSLTTPIGITWQRNVGRAGNESPGVQFYRRSVERCRAGRDHRKCRTHLYRGIN